MISWAQEQMISPSFKHKRQMEEFCKELIDEGDLNLLIHRIQIKRVFSEPEKLWIIWKVSQIQAARNIVSIAVSGLDIIGVEP